MSTHCDNNQRNALTSHRHPTRQAVLIDYTERVIHQTGAERTDIAAEIGRHYCAEVNPDQRSLKIEGEPDVTDGEAYARWKERTRKEVERFMNGTVRMPVEIEDAWVLALPQPYRSSCIQALTERMNRLAVEIPDGETSAADLGRVLKESGEEHVAASAVFANGSVEDTDLNALIEAERETRESAAASLSMAARFRAAIENKTDNEEAPLKAVK